MDDNLNQIQTEIYNNCGLFITDFGVEPESKEYDASRFILNEKKIISRTSKATPKKNGQFVTFWKRRENGPIEPFEESDGLDFFIVNVRTATNFGQFVFPKSILVKKGIISTLSKSGKRAFRVYPIWDKPSSMQAVRTQQWQMPYFFIINSSTDLNKVAALFQNE